VGAGLAGIRLEGTGRRCRHLGSRSIHHDIFVDNVRGRTPSIRTLVTFPG
jgi:hypothetical protein